MQIGPDTRLASPLTKVNLGSFTWIDLHQPTRDELEKVSLDYPFHQLNIEDCLSDTQVSKIDIYDDHSFVILRFPVIEQSVIGNRAKPLEIAQLAVFIGPAYLVTVHKSPVKQILQLLQSCELSGKAAAISAVAKSPARMLHKIVDGLVDELLASIENIDHDLDNVEKQVVGQHIESRNNLTDLRIAVAAVNRVVVPLRRVVMELSADVKRFSNGEVLAPYYSDIRDHIDKVLEELQASKDAVEIYNDTVFVAGTEKSNRILGILTILFTLTIPVTVLSSFYGMNIEIPGTVQSGPWTFWGPYTTLIVVTVESIIPAVLMLWYFYRKKWTQV